jgi:hypothetical protein
MSPTIAECLEHARQCEWYAARTKDEADRKFLLWRAQELKKRAEELEREAKTPEEIVLIVCEAPPHSWRKS